jgi:serine/threonine protein kinase
MEANHRIVSIANYALSSLTIGEGSFSKVKVARHKVLQKNVAMKLIKKSSIKDSYVLQNLEREANILGTLRHKNVVRLFEVLQSCGHYCLAMEYYAGGSVCDHIQANGKLCEADARKYMAQLMNGLQYVHSQGVLHRDLKLENLLLNFDRSVLAITDFGLSNFWQPGVQLNTFCGSPEYAAPELFAKDAYDTKIDVWSSGVVLFGMLTARLPFDAEGKGKEHMKELVRQIKASLTYKHLKKLSGTSKELRSLLSRMLSVDVELRISVPEILEDSWITAHSDLKLEVEVDNCAEDELHIAEACRHKLNLFHISADKILDHIRSPGGQFGKTAGCFNILRSGPARKVKLS